MTGTDTVVPPAVGGPLADSDGTSTNDTVTSDKKTMKAKNPGKENTSTNDTGTSNTVTSNTKTVKVPKPIKEAQEALIALKGSLENVCPEDLQCFDHQTMNKLYSSMRTSNASKNSVAQTDYAATCKSDLQRREWLARFIVDPSSGGCKAEMSMTAVNDKLDTEQEFLVTEDELGGPQWLNNPQHAKWAIEELVPQPHEWPSLAKRGVLQYKVSRKWLERQTGTKERASAITESTMTAEQFTQVSDAMRNSRLACDSAGTRRKKARTEIPPKQLSESEQLFKDTQKARDEIIKKVKGWISNCKADLAVGKIDLLKSKLLSKGYPQAMCDFVQINVEDQLKHVKEVEEKFNELLKVDVTVDKVREIQNAISSLRSSYDKREVTYTKFKSSYWKDTLRLAK